MAASIVAALALVGIVLAGVFTFLYGPPWHTFMASASDVENLLEALSIADDHEKKPAGRAEHEQRKMPEGFTEDDWKRYASMTPGTLRSIDVHRFKMSTHVESVLAGLKILEPWCKGIVRNPMLYEPTLRVLNLHSIPVVLPKFFFLHAEATDGINASDRADLVHAKFPAKRIDEIALQLKAYYAEKEEAGENKIAQLVTHMVLPDALPVIRLPDEDEKQHHPVVVGGMAIPEARGRAEIMYDILPQFFLFMVECWQRANAPRTQDYFMEYCFSTHEQQMAEGIYMFYLRPVTKAYANKHKLAVATFMRPDKSNAPTGDSQHAKS